MKTDTRGSGRGTFHRAPSFDETMARLSHLGREAQLEVLNLGFAASRLNDDTQVAWLEPSLKARRQLASDRRIAQELRRWRALNRPEIDFWAGYAESGGALRAS